MQAQAVLPELQALAARIISLVNEGRETLHQADADQWRALALARFAMLKALGRFITFKEEEILLPIIRDGNPATLESAREIKDVNEELQSRYDEFILRWAMTAPRNVDDSYKAEAFEMAATIESRILADVALIERLVATHASAAGMPLAAPVVSSRSA